MEWVLRTTSARVPNRDLILIPPKFLQASFYRTDPARPTVIAIGDSFTAGNPVNERDSYPAILEHILASQGVAAQVINAGIGDSGPDQHLRFLRQYLLPRLHPSAVVWTFYCNDIDDNYSKPVYELSQGKLAPLDTRSSWLYIRQAVHLWAPLPRWVKKHSFTYRILMKAIESLGPFSLPHDYAANPMAWAVEKLRLEIHAVKELAAERNFVLYFVLIAPESAYLAQTEPERWSRDWTAQPHQTLLAMLEGKENFIHAWFPAIDPAKIFADSNRDANQYGNRHYNEAGYALLAETIARRMLSDLRFGINVTNEHLGTGRSVQRR
jgi:lysophospholipase L1-like esterase